MEIDDALPISGLQHLAFCPRQWALIHLEQAWAENRLTAEGRLLHERADLPGQSQRGALRTVRGLQLHSARLRLTGRADIVEFNPNPSPSNTNAVNATDRLRPRPALRPGVVPGRDADHSGPQRSHLLR